MYKAFVVIIVVVYVIIAVAVIVQAVRRRKKILNNYTDLAARAGLSYDEAAETICGERNGYPLLIYAANESYPYMLSITASAGNGVLLEKSRLSGLKKSVAPITSVTQKGNLLTVMTKNMKPKKLAECLNEVLDSLTAFLREQGLSPCCQTCGAPAQTTGFMVKSARLHLCPDCAAKIRSENAVKEQEREQRSVNIVGGIIGAFVGALIGLACMLFFSRLGYVTLISGVVMGFCTLKGFDLLGGKLTKFGIVISCVIMLLMTWFGNRLDWAIDLAEYFAEYYDYNVGILECFRAIPEFVNADSEVMRSYIATFAEQIIFILVGAVPTITSTTKKQKNLNRVARIGVGKADY